MVYTYTPAYYSTLQDSITSICKSILPFSLKKLRLPASERKLSKKQSDNLKWQQNSFHQILNLMGLCKEGIVSDTEVSAFRSELLDTLVTSKGTEHDHPLILRDKLLFLQELLYAKCISAEEYHASQKPLLQRLAVQGAEVEAKDVIVAPQKEENSEELWSVIDLKDEQNLLNKENSSSKKSKHGSAAIKHIKGAASVLGFGSSQKHGKSKDQRSIFEVVASSNQCAVDSSGMPKDENGQFGENPFWDSDQKDKESDTKSILMSENLTPNSDKIGTEPSVTEKAKKKVWGLDGFKKWKKSNAEGEAAPTPLKDRSNDAGAFAETSKLVASPVGEGPDAKQIKRKLLSDDSSSGFFIDKVLGDNIKKELSRIQAELSSKSPNFRFSDDQMDAISTKLPVDKAELNQFFPKSWCDRYGDVVLNVVDKEFKDHVGEMADMRKATCERRETSSKRWTTFEDDENCHPNLFPAQHQTYSANYNPFTSSNEGRFWQ